MKKITRQNNKPKFIIFGILVFTLAICFGVGIKIKTEHEEITISAPNVGGNDKAEIEYAKEPIPAKITLNNTTIDGVETGQGSSNGDVDITSVDGYSIPTVEAVESNTPVAEEDECVEGEECGRGSYFSVDISTPQAFANATLGKCIDVDGHYGSQCWDLMALYFYNYTGHTFYTCGTGAAKGTIADGCWQKNAGDEFIMIWNPENIQAGDIAVYSTGTWGHTGMAMGSYNNGYFTLLGENQGGRYCEGGGGATNIINLSTRDFIGAFRPKIYIKPEPEPEPEPEPSNRCKTRNVVKGDTMGKIMQECEGKIIWGQAMYDYANHWYSTKLKPEQTVYYGWTHGTGYGLYAGDVIEYR